VLAVDKEGVAKEVYMSVCFAPRAHVEDVEHPSGARDNGRAGRPLWPARPSPTADVTSSPARFW